MELRFLADDNVGKLARWLRIIGYDTIYFRGGSDREMLEKAIIENRIILTRDTHIGERRIVITGKLKVILLKDDDPEKQLKEVVDKLKLDYLHKPFSLCLECNTSLIPRQAEEVKDIVPPYVFQKQKQYFQCPSCSRIYWGGSHKQAMEKKLKDLMSKR